MSEFPQAVQDKLKQLDEEREIVLLRSDAVRDAEEIIAAHGSDEDDVKFESSGLCANFYVKHFSAMTPILREFARRGHRVVGSPLDCFEVNGRMWLCGVIRVWGMLSWRGATACKRVQTGTRETPVYEWQCDPPEEVAT